MTVLLGELHPSMYGGRPTVVLAVAGELDLATAPDFQCRLIDAVDRGEHAVVVDMRAVSFCDCRGFAALLTAARYAEAVGHRIVVINPAPSVRRLFDLLNAEEVLDIRSSLHPQHGWTARSSPTGVD